MAKNTDKPGVTPDMIEEVVPQADAATVPKAKKGDLVATTRFFLEHGYNRYFNPGEIMPADLSEKEDGKLLNILKDVQGVVTEA